MYVRVFFAAVVLSITFVFADVTFINHDQVQPFPQPKPKTDSEKAAVKFKPQLLVSYGCHPYPAVQADGSVSAGLKGTGPASGECTGSSLGSQVYSRSAWYNDKWAIMYTWYFPKGRTRYWYRHFWEGAVVWIDDPASKNSTILGVTINFGWKIKTQVPLDGEFRDGSSVKLDSFFSWDSPRPRLRFTAEEGEFQDLITWEQLTKEARDALSTADFSSTLFEHKVQQMPLTDEHFEDRLEDAWPF